MGTTACADAVRTPQQASGVATETAVCGRAVRPRPAHISVHDVLQNYIACLERGMLWKDWDLFIFDCSNVQRWYEEACHYTGDHDCHEHREEDVNRSCGFHHDYCKRVRHSAVGREHRSHSKQNWHNSRAWILVFNGKEALVN